MLYHKQQQQEIKELKADLGNIFFLLKIVFPSHLLMIHESPLSL